jgi:prevent-host-death family protein
MHNSQRYGDLARHSHQNGHTWSMARKVSIAEARNHLTVLIRDVERGKKIELTRRGKRVAVLVSSDEYDRLRAARPPLDQALQAWRSRLPADFEGFSDEEVRSWRDPSSGREVRFG